MRFAEDFLNVLMSGGSGFVGTALTQSLRANGHTVAHLVRPGSPARPGDVRWDPNSASVDMASMEGVEAVVHLSGANIAGGRWTQERKNLLRSSRVDTTRLLVDAMGRLREKPRVFVCASAVGYYGDRHDEILTESSSNANNFLALLTRDWEGEAARASHAGVRTVMLRFGVILSPNGGALPKMIAPFRWGVGGRLGSGQQWTPWVALDDVIQIATNAILDERYTGPINVAAPNSARNADFTRIVADVLHRPAIFPAPAFALRLALGEMADEMLLASQHVVPARLQSLNYSFHDEDLEPTLRRMLP
jgi:uncharacterized protein (TIGR01777 family)